MKRLLLSLFLLLNTLSYGQTLIAYDNIETWNWLGGWWIPALTTGYYTNYFVSSNSSAVIYGVTKPSENASNSNIEQDWYSLPNIVVSPTHSHTFRFRLGSYRATSTASGSGVDGPDYVTVQLSTDNEVTYVNEMRITGFSNAYWNYNGAIAAKTANGGLTIYAPTAGGNRTTTGDGYSVIELTIPSGVSNIAVDLYCRVNATGEEWWIDNISLTQNTGLPIELISFEGTNIDSYNLLTWSSATEHNNDYYLVERSTDGFNWSVVNNQNGAGNSTSKIDYSFRDFTYEAAINYYRLTQVDIDGQSETFKTISLNNLGKTKEVLYFTNLLGQIVNDDVKGNLIVHYTDGTTERIYR
jgi:hypothetical protein